MDKESLIESIERNEINIAIQCSGAKRPYYYTGRDGIPVKFVDDFNIVEGAYIQPGIKYALLNEVDECDPYGRTYYQIITDIQKGEHIVDRNWDYGLTPAYNLYTHPIYAHLAKKFGPERIHIMSAVCWGLVKSDFQLGEYDILYDRTTKGVPSHLKDNYIQRYNEIDHTDWPLINLTGLKFLKRMDHYFSDYSGTKLAFFNTLKLPKVSGYHFAYYSTDIKTNWHYNCIEKFILDPVKLIKESEIHTS